MKNPFEESDVKLRLNLNELFTLLGIVSSCVPNINDEPVIIKIYKQIEEEISRLQRE